MSKYLMRLKAERPLNLETLLLVDVLTQVAQAPITTN